MLTWNQLSIHDKPIFILNTAGFYDGLLQHVSNMLSEDFLYHDLKKSFTVINEPAQLFK